MNIVHKPSNVFLDSHIHYKSRQKFLKSRFKDDLYGDQVVDFMALDHLKEFAQKPKHQKGPAKISQSFVVGRPYQTEDPLSDKKKLDDLILKCNVHKLQMAYKKFLFQTHEAWCIVVAHEGVDLEKA